MIRLTSSRALALAAVFLCNDRAATQTPTTPECGTPTTYPCPPPRPDGPRFATRPALENYRVRLEEFRKDVERERKDGDVGDASSKDYGKAIEDYKEGIDVYRDSVSRAGPN